MQRSTIPSMYMFRKVLNEMDQVVDDYTRMGFPGCVGSMDVTHLYWNQCPVLGPIRNRQANITK